MIERAIVQFSGGAASYVAGRLAEKEFGPENTVWLFADTKVEDHDLYRFIRDVERRINQPIIRIAEGRTPWEVFHDEGMIGNTRADLCSRILKREPLRQWLEDNSDPARDGVVIGYDAEEGHRLMGPAARLRPWKVRYPLHDAGFFKPHVLEFVIADGLRPSRAYRDRAPHDNCGGGCIKGGQAHWRWVYRHRRDVYDYHEAEEQRFRRETGKDVAILRDRRGGVTRPLTLREFRLWLEADERGQSTQIDLFDWGACSCMEPSLEAAV